MDRAPHQDPQARLSRFQGVAYIISTQVNATMVSPSRTAAASFAVHAHVRKGYRVRDFLRDGASRAALEGTDLDDVILKKL